MGGVMPGHRASEDARKRTYVPGIHGFTCCDGSYHASPPARSASGGRFGRDPELRSARLYHLNRPATATMTTMPSPLSRNCIHTAPETSTMAKWAAKDKNTPRQKISSECCPHAIGAHSQRDFNPVQSRGVNHSVTTASARKWA